MTLTFKQTKKLADQAYNYYIDRADNLRKFGGFLNMGAYELNGSDWAYTRLVLVLEAIQDLRLIYGNRQDKAETAEAEAAAVKELDYLTGALNNINDLIEFAKEPEVDSKGTLQTWQVDNILGFFKTFVKDELNLDLDSLEYTQVLLRIGREAARHVAKTNFRELDEQVSDLLDLDGFLGAYELDLFGTVSAPISKLEDDKEAAANEAAGIARDNEVAQATNAPTARAEAAINELHALFLAR